MFLLRSSNRVKYLHGSFIRKMCASNSKRFQWVTLYELDSIKISPGFKAAVIVQGRSAAQALEPSLHQAGVASHGSWACTGSVALLSQHTAKPSRSPNQGLKKRSPGPQVASLPLQWCAIPKESSDGPSQVSGSAKGGLKDPNSSRALNLSELKLKWEVVSLSAPLDLPHGKESCSASLAIDLNASTRKWTFLSLPPQQIFLISNQDLFDLK